LNIHNTIHTYRHTNVNQAGLLDIVVVVPLANQESNIDEFLKRVLAQLQDRDRVLCVLDNVSRDGTVAKIQSFAETRDHRVIPVWAPDNTCVVDAYFAGYRKALDLNPAWILEMDGGFSHLPEEMPRFFAAMKPGIDFIAGSRFMPGGSHTGSAYRRFVSWGGSRLANLVLGTTMRDMTSGFECFTREALSHVVQQGVRSKAHFFQTEIRFMMHTRSWVEVPISYRNTGVQVGRDSLLDALKNLWYLYRTKP
jgi:dolichol-phosphate mannosyltransferase